jgi:hypothetical protein
MWYSWLELKQAAVDAAESEQPMDLMSLLRLIATAIGFLGGSLLAAGFLVPRVMKQWA